MTKDEFNKLTRKKGYGIAAGFKPALKASFRPAFGKGSSPDQDSDPDALPELESGSEHGQVGEAQVALNYSGIVHIKFQVFRYRLLDYSECNVEKYWVDCCTYGNIIVGDAEGQIKFTTLPQVKIPKTEQERVEITLEYEDLDYDNPWVPKETKTKGKK